MGWSVWLSLLFLAAVAPSPVSAQAEKEPAPESWRDRLLQLNSPFQPQDWEGSVRRFDRQRDTLLEKIVSRRAVLEKLVDTPSTGPRKAPLWIRKGGYLLYSDVDAKAINKWGASEWGPRYAKAASFLENIRANGLALDPELRLAWAGAGRVFRREDYGQRTVLADDYDERPLREPTDLAYKSDGSLYFTDPGQLGWDEVSKTYVLSNQPSRIFRLQSNQLQLLSTEVSQASGLAFSPDEKYLYVVSPVAKAIVRFEVVENGAIANPSVLLNFDSGSKPCYPSSCLPGSEAPVAVRVDQAGNIYAGGPGGVWIISPDGKQLGVVVGVQLPVLGLAFGGEDGMELFITSEVRSEGESGLARIRLNVAGAGWIR